MSHAAVPPRAMGLLRSGDTQQKRPLRSFEHIAQHGDNRTQCGGSHHASASVGGHDVDDYCVGDLDDGIAVAMIY